LFENTTYEDWEIVMGPRVQGAWNLHQLMPNNLDFFIALGSFLGDTGNGGQAIYAGTAVSCRSTHSNEGTVQKLNIQSGIL
jgi:hypothetical protein